MGVDYDRLFQPTAGSETPDHAPDSGFDLDAGFDLGSHAAAPADMPKPGSQPAPPMPIDGARPPVASRPASPRPPMPVDYDELFTPSTGLQSNADTTASDFGAKGFEISRPPVRNDHPAPRPEHRRPPIPVDARDDRPPAAPPPRSRHARRGETVGSTANPRPDSEQRPRRKPAPGPAPPTRTNAAPPPPPRRVVPQQKTAPSTDTLHTPGAVSHIGVPPVKKSPARLVSRRGWRRWVHRLTRINVGLSRAEKYDLELRTRIRRNPRGSYQIAILGLKGGVGKTTVTVALGSVFAQVRRDRILAFDADASCGNLADRAGRQSDATIADLLADKELAHYNDVRAHTSANAVNLEVLPAEDYSTARRAFSEADWHYASDAVSRFYNLVLADCGAGLFDPVTRGVLSTTSAVVIVTSASIDGARQAAVAIDWLRNNDHQDLLSRACVVINNVSPGETNIAAAELSRQFGQYVQPGRIIVLPWDKHIAAGTEIQLHLLDPAYKHRVLELAAALSDDFDRSERR
ncbi:hypothetical protein A5647_11345 [Mycobacterium sp. 1100029.7]|nr:hypothetical protein A5647_11345 [Mycobacterium sp. 1100029.7]